MESTAEPIISVIIPAHNAEAHVAACLASVLMQSEPTLEIIVVNDASTDGTGRAIDTFAAKDPRVRPHHLTANVGVHTARAMGLAMARGRYLGFVDGDDWIAPGMFAKLGDALVREHADIAICGATFAVAPDRLAGPKVFFGARAVVADRLVERFARLEFGSGVLWNKLFTRDVLLPSGTRPLERAVDAAEDYIVNFGAFAAAKRVVTLPESLYFYRLDPESATRRTSRAQSFCRTVRAYVVSLETYAPGRPNFAPLIDELYTRQLRFESYAVDSADELAPFGAHLAESLGRLGQVHPAGLYALVHAFDLPRAASPLTVRPAVRQLGAALGGVGRALRGRWARRA